MKWPLFSGPSLVFGGVFAKVWNWDGECWGATYIWGFYRHVNVTGLSWKCWNEVVVMKFIQIRVWSIAEASLENVSMSIDTLMIQAFVAMGISVDSMKTSLDPFFKPCKKQTKTAPQPPQRSSHRSIQPVFWEFAFYMLVAIQKAPCQEQLGNPLFPRGDPQTASRALSS